MRNIVVILSLVVFLFVNVGVSSARDHRYYNNHHSRGYTEVVVVKKHIRFNNPRPRHHYPRNGYYRGHHSHMSTGDALIVGAAAGLVIAAAEGVKSLFVSQHQSHLQPTQGSVVYRKQMSQQEYDYRMQEYNQCFQEMMVDLKQRRVPRDCDHLRPVQQ